MNITWYGLSKSFSADHVCEDSILVPPPHQKDPVFAVFDGLGGYPGGEVASAMALRVLQDDLAHSPDKITSEQLFATITKANFSILTYAAQHPRLHRMSTTALVASIENQKVRLLQLGDSRAYLYRDGKMKQLTEDHTIAWTRYKDGELTKDQLVNNPDNCLLTKALGLDYDMKPEMSEIDMDESDILLLCSDGLSDVTTDGKIAEHLQRATSLKQCARKLYQTARENGSYDDISIILVSGRLSQ